MALPQALDFGTLQRHSCLENFDNRIVVPRFAIGGDDLFAATPAARRLGPARVLGHSYCRTYRRKVT